MGQLWVQQVDGLNFEASPYSNIFQSPCYFPSRNFLRLSEQPSEGLHSSSVRPPPSGMPFFFLSFYLFILIIMLKISEKTQTLMDMFTGF
jgi:hypothetical protein